MKPNTTIRDLGDGLILRHSSRKDIKALATFNAMIHSEEGPDQPDERVAAWTRDLLSGHHPTHNSDDFTIVEETKTGRIVSAMNLISQTWSYEGIPFGVGRPELVGTLPEYRNRGLVRVQFDEVHKWSAERGELVQGITGIPYFYRQFGYEMGLELGGGRTGFEPQLPKLSKGEKEPVTFRKAVETDIPFMMEIAAHAARRHLITCPYDETMWRYVLSGQSKNNVNRHEFRIIERSGTKEPLGYLMHPWYHWNTGLIVNEYELKPGTSWLEVTPAVARYLWKTGGSMLSKEEKPRTAYAFWLGLEHPAYEVLREALPRVRQPYAWYIRVPDLPGFLMHIKPVLERRLAESIAVGYSGKWEVRLYRSGVRMAWEKGTLAGIEAWQPKPFEEGQAAFPNLTLLRQVFGHATLDELKSVFADCWYRNDETRLLLNILFPKKPSSFFGVS